MSVNHGHVDLRGMTTLKNRQPVPDKPGHYIYDGLFSCAELTELDEDGIGSFCHYMGNDYELKEDGTYQMHAKVDFITS